MGRVSQRLKDAGFGFKNEFGCTASQAEFCRFVSQGDSQSDAYRKAFNVKTAKPETVWQMASKMAKKPQVKALLESLFKEQAAL